MGTVPTAGAGPRRRRSARGGFTLVEIGLAMTILMVALLAMSASTLRMHALRRQNRERAIAQNALVTISEEIHARAARALADDPASWAQSVTALLSPGGALGTTFDVAGLTPQEGQPAVGSIQVVVDETATDQELGVELGMPRDLNGDGDANDIDVSTDARLIPVILRTRWRGITGDVTITHPLFVIGY